MVQYIHWSLTDLSERAHHDRSQRCIDERGEGVGGERGRERMGGGGRDREGRQRDRETETRIHAETHIHTYRQTDRHICTYTHCLFEYLFGVREINSYSCEPSVAAR